MSITESIQNIRFAGDHPLLQYDLLDAYRLRQRLLAEGFTVTAWRLSRILRAEGMRSLGPISLWGKCCYLWTCLPPQPLVALKDLARERARTNATELHTEILIHSGLPVPPAAPLTLLTQFEREVLTMRLGRYLPRHIAYRLKAERHTVNAACQNIRVKLGLRSWKDKAAVRNAVHKTGALMDDPAFR